TVLDVGTGAGVPGLILKLLRPDLEIVLADAVRKKVSFLNAVIAFTGLRGIWAEHGRIGDAGIPGRVPIGGFDLVVSQAVTTVEGLVDIAGPMLSQKGIIISMKGPGAEEELKDKKELLQSRGWEIIVRMTRSAVRGYDRRLVLISRHEPVTRRQDIGNDRNAE
ncbi:MAG TPA: 16S rRNA (guanine(527)-N(7))-methyltransferase RsmG, partial [Thermodesulfobacteriaceae bacterium]|nr:16S rRNA (guanine(527)-N(7))-methyltransferase RsmG [Thermodesulfobacteriaceae bacterium]